MLWRPPPLAVPVQQSDSHFLATLSEWPPSLTLQVQQRGSRFLVAQRSPPPLTTAVQQRGFPSRGGRRR